MSPRYFDALRGYAHVILKRDRFACRYCGLDGSKWPNWLYLSWDHLLPVGHPERDNPDYIVAACRFCNEACNRTKWIVEGKTPDELVDQKRPFVLARREEYKMFWEQHVKEMPDLSDATKSSDPSSVHQLEDVVPDVRVTLFQAEENN